MPALRWIAATIGVAAALVAVPAPAQEPCDITGTEADDVLVGTDASETICGLEGNDRIEGLAGADVLIGGDGEDVLSGGDGADRLEGGAETDLLYGGEGDTLLGEDGEDYLSAPGGTLDGGAGTDTCATPGASCIPPSPPDADDVRGPLDMRRVLVFPDPGAPVWRVATFARWTARALWDHGFVFVFVDSFGAPAFDYRIQIRSAGRRMRAALFRNGVRLARLPVWRRDRSSVSVRLPLSLIRRERDWVRWSVTTLSDRCRGWCIDRVADEGGVIQPVA